MIPWVLPNGDIHAELFKGRSRACDRKPLLHRIESRLIILFLTKNKSWVKEKRSWVKWKGEWVWVRRESNLGHDYIMFAFGRGVHSSEWHKGGKISSHHLSPQWKSWFWEVHPTWTHLEFQRRGGAGNHSRSILGQSRYACAPIAYRIHRQRPLISLLLIWDN